jgi:hypothetical protein
MKGDKGSMRFEWDPRLWYTPGELLRWIWVYARFRPRCKAVGFNPELVKLEIERLEAATAAPLRRMQRS